MADGSIVPNGEGSNGPVPLTEDEFLTLQHELEEAESEHAEALEACKAPRKRVKEAKEAIAARIPWDAFVRMREDIEKPGAVREQEHQAYRQLMAWKGKPIGSQGMFEFSIREAGSAEQLQIEKEGYTAGKAGHGDEGNSYTPGTDRFTSYQNGYTRGRGEFMAEQERIAAEMAPPPDADAPKKRGRPKGSKNKTGAPASVIH